MLLGGEPADVSDDQLAVRGEATAQRLVTQFGPETRGVDAPLPQPYPRHAVFREVADGGAGRGERAVGGAVDGADPAPRGRLAGAHIGACVAGEVGLVDGDGGDAEPGGGRHATHAEHEGAGQVDEVGAVSGDGRRDAPAGQRHPHLRVARGAAGRARVRPGTVRRISVPAATAGAMTSGSWPRATRCRAVCRAQWATPLTSGGKDSVTMTTRIPVLSSRGTCPCQRGSVRRGERPMSIGLRTRPSAWTTRANALRRPRARPRQALSARTPHGPRRAVPRPARAGRARLRPGHGQRPPCLGRFCSAPRSGPRPPPRDRPQAAAAGPPPGHHRSRRGVPRPPWWSPRSPRGIRRRTRWQTTRRWRRGPGPPGRATVTRRSRGTRGAGPARRSRCRVVRCHRRGSTTGARRGPRPVRSRAVRPSTSWASCGPPREASTPAAEAPRASGRCTQPRARSTASSPHIRSKAETAASATTRSAPLTADSIRSSRTGSRTSAR